MTCSSLYAQHVPDPSPEPASNSHFYYQNSGQIVDNTGALRPDVQYYTERTSPAVYICNDKVSFVASKIDDDTLSADTSFRIDMGFACHGMENPEMCGTIQTYEPSADHLNYYLPHCPSGITVGGYAGVMYQNAFANTDVHLYSDDMGLKTYVVFRPGADTSDFLLRFTGQDSIVATANFLELYVGPAGMVFPDATAYQVNSVGVITPLPWLPLWRNNGSGMVSLSFGSYNPTQNLVIKIGWPRGKISAGRGNLQWSTFYGGNGVESAPIVRSNSNGDLYHLMAVVGTTDFPSKAGTNVKPINGTTVADCYVSMFDNNLNRQWATYFGGSGAEFPLSMAEATLTGSEDVKDLFIAGNTFSGDMPTSGTKTPAFQKVQYGGNGDGFIANFNKTTGELAYATYYGGESYDEVSGLTVNGNNNTALYFCGNTESKFPTTSNSPAATELPLRRSATSQHFQSTIASAGADGVVGKILLSDGSLNWATYFGGNNSDQLNAVLFENGSGSSNIYIVGETFSSPGSLPLTNPGGKAYFQNHQSSTSGTEGLIGHFNASETLDWCTYFGGNGDDRLWKAASTSGGDIYISGVTTSDPTTTNSSQSNISGLLPIFTPATASYTQSPGSVNTFGQADGFDDMIIRFSPSHQLKWSSYFGGAGEETAFVGSSVFQQRFAVDIAVDNTNTVYLASYTRLKQVGSVNAGDIPMPAVLPGNRYNQTQNASSGVAVNATTNPITNTFDGYIAQFRPDNSLKWATHFGGLTSGFSSPDPNNREVINSIAVGGSTNVTLYMTGTTRSSNTPTSPGTPVFSSGISGEFFDNSYNAGGQDVFIGRFTNANNTGINMAGTYASGNTFVMPNPSTGLYNVNYINYNASVKTARVLVYNAAGQVITDAPLNIVTGENRYRIDISEAPAGIYLLQVRAGDKTESVKLNKY